MGFKDTIQKERHELQSVKKPYETVAFIIFALMFLQNILFMFVQIIDYFSTKFWSFNNFLTRMNNTGFIMRISNIFTKSQFMQMAVAILLFALYWGIIWYFVWNYCKKQKLAKWTWTLFVVYGPNIFLATPVVFFVIYVFRPYFARFAKRFVEEFKTFDPSHEFEEEKAEEYNATDYDQYIKDEPYYDDDSTVEDSENNKDK